MPPTAAKRQTKAPKRPSPMEALAQIREAKALNGRGPDTGAGPLPHWLCLCGERNAHGVTVCRCGSTESGATPAPQIEMIPLDQVIPSKRNPRKEFDDEKLGELAHSIQELGILQPLVVRSPIGGKYELVAGERRLRAAPLAGLAVVPCIVRDMSDGDAAIARIEENIRRADLSPIEEAMAFRDATGKDGLFTQGELAARLGVTQSFIANRIRLLELPQVWLDRMISQEITATHARALVPWCSYPDVLEELESNLEMNGCRTVAEWEDVVLDSVAFCGRTMDPKKYNGPEFKPTDEQRACLDIVELGSGKNRQLFAMNVSLWDELQRQAREKKAKREQPKDEPTPAKTSSPAKVMTAAEIKAKAEQAAEQFNKRLYRWRIGWLQTQIAVRLADARDEMIWKVVLYFAVRGKSELRQSDLGEIIKAHGGSKAIHYEKDIWAALSSLSLDEMRSVAHGCVIHWAQHACDKWQTDNAPPDVEAIAAELGVDVKRDWILSRDFLELHTTKQLLGLAAEWKCPIDETMKRTDLVDRLEGLAAAKCPAELLKAKPCCIVA